MTDITLLTKYVAGKLPLEDFWGDFGEGDGTASPIDLLNISFGHAIDELSRPIDAIRHQAKTVTVGTSRKEEIMRGVLFDLLSSLRVVPKNLKAENILMLERIQKAITGVRGYTLYEIGNLDVEGHPMDDSTISIVNRGGVSVGMVSRAETSKSLMGTKRTIVRTGNLYVGLGRVDGRPLVIIPLLKSGEGVSGLLLVHVDFNPTLSAADKEGILGDRFRDIQNLIQEYNLSWDDAYLSNLPIEILLGESVEFIAAKIRKTLDAKKEEPPA
jgi:glucosamine--fructose-6-phosphate aminotransferase (isomerizing)